MNQEETIKEIVLARLHAIPNNAGVSFGIHSGGVLSKEDMIQHVQRGDPIGKEIIRIQMDFLTSLKKLEL